MVKPLILPFGLHARAPPVFPVSRAKLPHGVSYVSRLFPALSSPACSPPPGCFFALNSYFLYFRYEHHQLDDRTYINQYHFLFPLKDDICLLYEYTTLVFENGLNIKGSPSLIFYLVLIYLMEFYVFLTTDILFIFANDCVVEPI